MPGEHADSGWDDYAERVLRNEGRLDGLEDLVKEIRESDRTIGQQRADSLAKELERRADALLELVTARADAVLLLSQTEREADLREARSSLELHKHEQDALREADKEQGQMALNLLREVYDTAISENHKQSDMAARYGDLRQQVVTWRESDREARDIAGVETSRRLDDLNHADEKRQEFQANAVTRELFSADREAQTHRENVLRDQIIAMDRTILGLQPTVAAEKVNQEMGQRFDAAIAAAARTLDAKIGVNSDKINELKSYRDTQSGRATGYSAFYGWAVAAVGLLITIIIGANALVGKHP